MKTIKSATMQQGLNIKVMGKNSYGEFEVRVYKNGKLLPDLTYYTDNKDDALNTAAYMYEKEFK